MTRPLCPSISVALDALTRELDHLKIKREYIVELDVDNRRGAIMIATDSDREHGVIIYGMTDEETAA